MEVIRADELDNPGPVLASMFVEGFGQHLQYFSKDPKRLAAAFEHMFLPDHFFVAVEDGVVIAMAGIASGNELALKLDATQLRRGLGLFKGTIAAIMLGREWNRGYPIPVGDEWGSIQFVASAAGQRRRGGARAVLDHLIAQSGYTTFILEVGDLNAPAVALYESLGFTETARLPDPDAKYSGYNYRLYLRLDRAD